MLPDNLKSDFRISAKNRHLISSSFSLCFSEIKCGHPSIEMFFQQKRFCFDSDIAPFREENFDQEKNNNEL